VIHTLVDVVSKNGNLMLNIPVRGDGTIDEQERAIVEEIGRWMKANSEGIYDTRPWVVFGEGPAMEGAALEGPGFNEGKGKPFTDKDMRFTTKGGVLYVFLMEWPADGVVKVKSLGTARGHRHAPVNRVTLLRNGETLKFEVAPDGVIVHLPEGRGGYAETLRIE
jgi:alpha-L-fucosidase